jgi:hypothetical protein
MSEKDKILQFLKENPGIFISGISHYYPLSTGFMERYRDLLDWDNVIYNDFIKIDFEFCRRFRTGFDWYFFEPWLSKEECIINIEPDLVDAGFLEEFKNELNWSRFCYSGSNDQLSDENIFRFNDRINFKRLSSNMKKVFTEELIHKYEDKWDWEGLSGRDDLPWSYEFIRKYETRWAWDYLLENPDIPWTEEILDIAEYFLSPEEIDTLRNNRWRFIDNNQDEPSYENLMEQNISGIDIYSAEEFAGILNNFNPAQHSSDIRIPWTAGLIDFYKDEWDWKELSCNESLPWSEELIDRYLDIWYWGDKIARLKHMNDDETDDFGINTGLSDNKGIPWTNSMIHKYRNYLVWHFFAYHEGIEWSIDLLIEHKARIDKTNITMIKKLWEKVFLPQLNEEIMSGICKEKRQEILEIILKRKKRMELS